MPWSPTRHFPHPLVNLRGAEAEPELSNYLSYKFLDWITWQGLGNEINNFRSRRLGLERLDTVSAISMMRRAEIPHTYCWFVLSSLLVGMASDEKLQVKKIIAKTERLVIEYLSRRLLRATTSSGLQTIRILDGVSIKWSKTDIYWVWFDRY